MRASRAAEMVLLFVVGPLVVALVNRSRLLLPAVWVLGAACLVILLLEPRFVRGRLWNWRGVRKVWPGVWVRFLMGASALTAVLLVNEPGNLFGLPQRSPILWGAIIVLYPLLSVYPQEVAFRACFLHRYACLFRSRALLLVTSAAVFAFAHIVMHDWWAVGLCFVGGLLFGWTYLKSRSLAAVCLEHSLYGWFLFTIGWGRHFYMGTFGH